jgi:hypothetical protein
VPMVPVRDAARRHRRRVRLLGVFRLRREGAGGVSYDVWVEVDAGGPEPIVVGDLNYTSNVFPVLRKVLGRSLAEFDEAPCSEAGGILASAATAISADYERFRPLVRGGGEWGTAEGAAEFLGEIAALCASAPRGMLRVWA